MDIRTIILDFDGTIVESVGIKDKAFRVLYEEYPEKLDEIMEYHLDHNATVRYHKFRHIAENILKEDYTEEKEEELSEKFAELVFKNIVKCPYVEGGIDFLEYFYRKVPLYLVSASPEDELDRILDERELKKYFKDVYAIPWVKKDAVKEILLEEGINAEEAVFIGDTMEDYESASSSGVKFIARNSNKPFNGINIDLFKDMVEIREYLVKNMTKEQGGEIG